MTKRSRLLLLLGGLGLTCISFLVPGSPLYLGTLLNGSSHYQGRPTWYWLARMKSTEVKARRESVHALGALGAEATSAVPALASTLLHDPDRGVRIEAALALVKLGPAAREALPALIQALEDPDSVIRMDVTVAILRLGPAAEPAVPALLHAIQDERNQTNCASFSCTIQDVAVTALGRASAGTEEAVPALRALLATTSRDQTREAVLRTLGELGRAARPAAPQIQALLDDPCAEVREAAEDALLRIHAG